VFRRAVCAVFAAGLLAGGVAWVQAGKTVSLEVDGAARRVHTYAATVGGVLDRLDLSVAPHDVLAPSAGVAVHEGSRIVLRRGRQLHLVINGKQRVVWTTARSVADAMAELGFLDDHSFVSASRSRPIGLDGLSLTVRLPVKVRILADGRLRTVLSTAPTVSALITSLHLKLGPRDQITPRMRSYPKAGTVVRIVRVRGRFEDVLSVIGHDVVRRADDSLFRGDTRVVVQGEDGVLLSRYALVFKDGRLVSRTLKLRKVQRAPTTGVLAYGTKRRPYSVGGSADGLNWSALARCESGGNPRSIGGGGAYRGLYQFTFGTWSAVGGSGDPIDASPEEQTYRAKLLYQRRGRSPWPVCGRYL
jgi:uncharacterized protein YabE (DUF348 family)